MEWQNRSGSAQKTKSGKCENVEAIALNVFDVVLKERALKDRRL
jgi:hypothetical protein